MSIATWANISTRRSEAPYTSPTEYRRLERVAVGKICRCGTCMCCAEYKAEMSRRAHAYQVHSALTTLRQASSCSVKLAQAYANEAVRCALHTIMGRFDCEKNASLSKIGRAHV